MNDINFTFNPTNYYNYYHSITHTHSHPLAPSHTLSHPLTPPLRTQLPVLPPISAPQDLVSHHSLESGVESSIDNESIADETPVSTPAPATPVSITSTPTPSTPQTLVPDQYQAGYSSSTGVKLKVDKQWKRSAMLLYSTIYNHKLVRMELKVI